MENFQLRSLIKELIKESDIRETKKWFNPNDLVVTDECAASIYEEERNVPYIYDDAKKMSGRLAKSLYGNIIDEPAIKKILARWPAGKIPYPVKKYSDASFPTIGVGHYIKSEEEFNKYKDYTLFNITHDEKGNKNSLFFDKEESDQFNAANSSRTLQAYLMPADEIIALYKSDLEIHSQFKSRITQPITKEMFEALVSYAFNSGWEENRPIEKVIKLINAKKYKQAQTKILNTPVTTGGEVSDGLISRRKRESEKFGEGGLVPPSNAEEIMKSSVN